MRKILIVKDGKHGLGYGYFLTKVFRHFGLPLDTGTKGTGTQTFSFKSLMEYECIEGRVVKLSRISKLLGKKERLR